MTFDIKSLQKIDFSFMTKNEQNLQEMVDNLLLMFPGVSKEECEDCLRCMPFDDAADVLSVSFYERNQNENDSSNNPLPQSDLSNDEKNLMVEQLTQNFPDLDAEIATDILEESNFDFNKAMLIAKYNQNIYNQVINDSKLEKLKKKYRNVDDMIIFNCLEAANFDFDVACNLLDHQDTSKKGKKKSKPIVISSSGIPIDSNRHIKIKNKPKPAKIPPTVKPIKVDNSPPDTMAVNIETLKALFDCNSAFGDRDYVEALKLSKNDLDHAYNILYERLRMIELRDVVNTQPVRIDDNPKLQQLAELFPLVPAEQLEESLASSFGDIQKAISKLIAISGETEQDVKVMKKSPSVETEEEDEVFWSEMPQRRKPSGQVNKTNRMPSRPSQGHRTKTTEIDLHGYTCQQASAIVNQALNDAKYNDLGTIIFVTGYGRHSHNNIAVLKPLVKRLCKYHGYKVVNGSNPGSVICMITD